MSSAGADSQSALHALGERQQSLLQLLQRHKEGRTADEIAEELRITRTAVRQHLAALERDRFVTRGAPRKTAGRPGFVYELSAQGRELFPRRYSWFSALLLEALQQQRGDEGLTRYLRDMAAKLAERAGADLPAASPEERVGAIAALMNDLGFDAESSVHGGEAEIRAYNCVYHHLAERFPALCRFDVELIRSLSGRDVDHAECMVRGGRACRFRLKPVVGEDDAGRPGAAGRAKGKPRAKGRGA